MAQFTMPSLGADMVEGTLTEWLVKPGDQVHKGDVIAVVDTSKSAVDVECFDTGVIERLLVDEGATVPVGTPLAEIAATARKPAPPVPAQAAPLPVAGPKQPTVSPIVRKLAHELGVDLERVHGSGRGGAPTRRDVEEAAVASVPRQPEPPPPVRPAPNGQRKLSPYARRLAADLKVDLTTMPAGRVLHAADVRAAAKPTAAPQRKIQPPSHMREAIAEAMAKSKREIPHYYLAVTVDMGGAMDWLHERNRSLPVEERLVPAALLLKATAVAAARVPALNGHWIDGAFVPAPRVDLGMAVALRGGGLLVPVLADAAQVPLAELMRWLRQAVTHARTGRLRSGELGAASLTVTNLGDLGVDVVHGVIHPPQVALVGFGAVTDRPWASGDLLGIRPVVTASLAADHRATDGATGARFLSTIATLLHKPEEL